MFKSFLTVAKSAIFCAYSVRVIMYTRACTRVRVYPSHARLGHIHAYAHAWAGPGDHAHYGDHFTQRRGFALQCFLVCYNCRAHVYTYYIHTIGLIEPFMRMRIIILAQGPSCSYVHVVTGEKLGRQKTSNVSSALHLKCCRHVIFSSYLEHV